MSAVDKQKKGIIGWKPTKLRSSAFWLLGVWLPRPSRAQSVVIEAPASYLDEFDPIAQDDPIVQDDDVIDFDGDAIVTSQVGLDRCAATFRSFDPTTGTYTGYDGLKRMCPYLE